MKKKTVSTVKIEADTAIGYMLVNESDFDPEKHTMVPDGKNERSEPIEDEYVVKIEDAKVSELRQELDFAGNDKRAIGEVKKKAKGIAADLGIEVKPGDNTAEIIDKIDAEGERYNA